MALQRTPAARHRSLGPSGQLAQNGKVDRLPGGVARSLHLIDHVSQMCLCRCGVKLRPRLREVSNVGVRNEHCRLPGFLGRLLARFQCARTLKGQGASETTQAKPPAFASLFEHGLARRHMHVMAELYERCRAKLDDIIERYRAGRVGDRGRATLTREQAVLLIRALGFTLGDAMRWLDAKPPRR